ncbi:MAG TPA: DUF1801 domain-containing protein [Bacteroidales bacterium]|nr:DUF1801 domain-containing protein [Bacteroidales bacterium]
MKADNAPNSVDKYISCFSGEIQTKLQQLRLAIRKAAPGAEEVISYQMPAYRQGKILVYFAAHKNHIGFYPTASGIEAFKNELSAYKLTKGTVQFPYKRPLPLKLVEKITRFRVMETALGKTHCGKSPAL